MIRPKIALCILLLCAGTSALAADPGHKLELLEAAVAGDPGAQYELAMIYEQEAYDAGDDLFEPAPEPWQKMLRWCEASAAQGHRGAQLALLQRGYDPTFGEAEHNKWFQLATEMAESGSKYAQYRLAEIYFASSLGDAMNADHRSPRTGPVESAIHWYNQLLEGLKPGEKVILSRLETFGREVTVDYIKEQLAYLKNFSDAIRTKETR